MAAARTRVVCWTRLKNDLGIFLAFAQKLLELDGAGRPLGIAVVVHVDLDEEGKAVEEYDF